jgi:hypothetical protein
MNYLFEYEYDHKRFGISNEDLQSWTWADAVVFILPYKCRNCNKIHRLYLVHPIILN